MKMSGRSVCCLYTAMLMMSYVQGFDITKMLSKYPAYTAFSNYLTQTGVAREINERQNVTVLAVDNKRMGGIAGKSMEGMKKTLRQHVVLGYLDLNQTMTVTLSGAVVKINKGAVKSGGVVVRVGAKPIVSKSDNNNSNSIWVVQVSSLMMAPVPVSQPITPNSPSPFPLTYPVPVISPAAPVSPPVLPTNPVLTPVPVISPVPVVSPVPVMSPVPATEPGAPASGGESDAPPGSATPSGSAADEPKSGVIQLGVHCSLALFLTFSLIYITPILYH